MKKIFGKLFGSESAPTEPQLLSVEEIVDQCSNNDRIIQSCVDIVAQLEMSRVSGHTDDHIGMNNCLNELKRFLAEKGLQAASDDDLKDIARQLGQG